MEGINKGILSAYEEVAVLDQNPRRNVVLVRNRFDGKFYVKKTLQNCDTGVLLQLRQHPHKNIAAVYDFSPLPESTLVIEEFVNGITLEQYLQQRGPLPEGEVMYLLMGICDGLSHLHSLIPPIIHRDIKLSNIMLSENSEVKIIDFNASRTYKASNREDTVILGTEGYAPPEQFGFQETDARSDIYALGVLTNYLLTGRHPKEMLAGGRLQKVIERCLSLDPENRYQSVEKFRAAAVNAGGPPTEKKKHLKLFTLPIPGFRTGTLWKMLVAMAGYGIILMGPINMKSTYDNITMELIYRFVCFLVCLGWVALFTNFGNIQSSLPPFRHRKLLARLSAYPIYFFLVAFFGALVVNIFQIVFKANT